MFKPSKAEKPNKPNKPRNLKKPLKISGFFVSMAFFMIYSILPVSEMGSPTLQTLLQDPLISKEQDEVNSQLKKEKIMTIGWRTWYPYEYLDNEAVPSSLTGLDVQLVKKIAKEAGYKPRYQPLSWDLSIEGLQNGTIDFASGATYTEAREAFCYYSKPYRFEENGLFVLRKKMNKCKFKNVNEFIEFMKKNDFRLGVFKKIVYADPVLNAFVNDPMNAKFIVFVEDEDLDKGLEKLISDEIDALIADRISGATSITESQYAERIGEIDLNMRAPIHLIFSKKTVSKETVRAFNQAIDKFLSTTAYRNIVSWYLYPVILLQTVETEWFRIIDMMGTLFFSISGILIARSLNASIFATFVYAVLPSLGGGLIRDVIFNQKPVDALSTPIYLSIVIGTIIIGFFIVKLVNLFEGSEFATKYPFYKKIYPHLKGLLVMCDALGLAAFTVTGVMVSLVAKANPLWLWGPFFSFLTGAVGTIIRDILSKSKKLADIEGELYSEVAVIWGLFLSVGLLMTVYNVRPDFIQGLVLITMLGTFLTRMLVYFFKVPNVYFK